MSERGAAEEVMGTKMETLGWLKGRILFRWPEWLLSLLVVLMFARVFASAETFYLRDIHSYVAPLKTLWRQRVLNGELPQWVPNIGLGLPMLADPSNQTLYPLAVVLLLPEPLGLEVFIVMHILLAGLGALRLARYLQADDAGAFLSGVTFALGGYVITVATTNCLYVCSAAFIPWVVLTMARLHSGESVFGGIARLSGLLALQLLGGDFQAVIFAAAAGFVVAVWITPRDRSVGLVKNILRSLGLYASSAAIGALLAAPQLLPALLFAPHSIRRKALALEDAQIFSTHPWRLLDIFASHPWGVPFGTYFGSSFEIGEKTIPWALSLYVGAACLTLVPLALSAGRREGRQRALKLMVLVALGLALTLGAHTPVYGWFHQYVPLFGRFRFPEKTFVLTAMLFALLNGLGVTVARPSGVSVFKSAWLPVSVLAVTLLGAGVIPQLDIAIQRSVGDQPLTSAQANLALEHAQTRLLLAACLGAAVLWAWLANRTKLLLGICVIDLMASGTEVPVSADVGEIRLAPEIARLVETGARDRQPTRFYDRRAVYDGTGGILVEQASSFASFRNRHLSSGVSYINAHSSSLPYTGFVLTWGLTDHGQRMARVASATSVIVADDVRGPFAGAREQARVGPFVWLENAQTLPRAYLLTSAFNAGSEQEAEALLFDERFPIERVALLTAPVPGAISPWQIGSAPAIAQPCDLTLYEPERVRFVCDGETPAVAVLADQFLDGWTLTVDGKSQESLPVQFALRGAVVPAGRHELEYRYRTPGLLVGFIAAAFGLLVLLLLWHARRRQWIA